MASLDINKKFKKYIQHKLFSLLSDEQQNLVKDLTFEFGFTFQEFRLITEYCRDLDMWAEESLADWWLDYRRVSGKYTDFRQHKKHFLRSVQEHIQELKA